MVRGDVCELRLPRGVGHEQRGRRYGVVVQTDELLPRSTVLVAPTSVSAATTSLRPDIDVPDGVTKVLVEQLGAVDVSRLGNVVGHLTLDERWSVDEALRIVLDLR